MGVPPSLEVTADDTALLVTVFNIGNTPLRLWERSCSWGWSILSLLLAPHAGIVKWREYSVKPVRWTRNFPKRLEIPSRGRFVYRLARHENQWEGLDLSMSLLKKPLQVRVRLRVTRTPEALSNKVFIGEVLSGVYLSRPPHRWLSDD